MARTVITLKGDPIVSEEEKALEAITPGHLVMLTATGVQKNTANAANVAAAFALERDELGKGIDVAYASGDYVKVGTFAPGMRVYAFLASGFNIAKGDYLTGNTTGLLFSTGVAAGIRLCRAVEAVNTSGSAPVAGTRIRVEIV
jgi:hypothetical protein